MPIEFYGYIYFTINICNYKRYIGQSKCRKLRNNKCLITNDIDINSTYIGSGTYFRKAVRKYGKHNFVKFIIKYCKTKEELDFYERFYISIYEAQQSSLFYNISEGGGNYNNIEFNPRKTEIITNWSKQRKGKKKTEEHKRKIGKSHKGWIPTEENKRNIGNAAKGRTSPMKGKHLSEETKQKLREWNLEHSPVRGMKRHHSEETRKKISESLKGKPSHMKGKHLTEETKQKLREWNLEHSPVRGMKKTKK